MKRELTGPGGIRLVLDSEQIFPDDPGQGTPAMVHTDQGDATYWCALGEGTVLDARCREAELSQSQMNWLEAQEDVVSTFLDEHTPS